MAGKRKRGNGEGSVFQRTDSNGKVIGWRGQQYIGDKRRSYSGRTKQEVIDKMALDRADYNRGVFVADDSITVGQWIDYWMEHKKRPSVKEQSFICMTSYFNNYILPYLEDVKLQDLTSEQIEEVYTQVFINGTKENGMPFSDVTIKQTSSYFNKCLKDAVAAGKLKFNPHDIVKRPRGATAKKRPSYSPEDQEKIVDFCKNSNNQTDWIFYFLIATGTRLGEATVLTWSDVDLQKHTVTINKTFAQVRGVFFVQDAPKTSKGNRTISIPNSVVDFLKKKKKAIDQSQNRKDLVFPNTVYNYHSGTTLRRRFQKICAILDIEYYGIHSLRHSWATRALEKGIPAKVVGEMLGHEDVTTTMNIYQDVLRNKQEEVADIMNDLF